MMMDPFSNPVFFFRKEKIKEDIHSQPNERQWMINDKRKILPAFQALLERNSGNQTWIFRPFFLNIPKRFCTATTVALPIRIRSIPPNSVQFSPPALQKTILPWSSRSSASRLVSRLAIVPAAQKTILDLVARLSPVSSRYCVFVLRFLMWRNTFLLIPNLVEDWNHHETWLGLEYGPMVYVVW